MKAMSARVVCGISAGLLVLATMGYSVLAADAAGCGTLISYSAPSATRPIGQVSLNPGPRQPVGQPQLTPGPRQIDFAMALPGTVTPANITGLGTALNPVLAQFRGAMGADGVVRDFTLTQVTSCPPVSLPSTNTTDQESWAWFALAGGLLAALAARASRHLFVRTPGPI